MIKVLHLCSDYAKQALYGQLLTALSRCGISQTMYVPVRTSGELGIGRVTGEAPIAYRYSHILRPHHRLFFRSKIGKVARDVAEHVPVSEHDVVHAHFLYSDGAVARRLQRRFGLPYIVAVRNTDINSFMRYRPDLAGVANDVLRNAARVVFLSPAYRDSFLSKISPRLRDVVAGKAMTAPNGLSQGWLDADPDERSGPLTQPLKLLYVGDFTPNKNIAGVVAALDRIRARQPATLTVVGGGADRRGEVQALLDARREYGVLCKGRITDPVALRAIYREHDILVMPSIHETFGLAYIEALSQGVPVIHSMGQGVDGYFSPGTVAEAVDPYSATSIAEGVARLVQRHPGVRTACREAAKQFDWSRIANIYRETYESLLYPAPSAQEESTCATQNH